jgi:hypothetical protein
MKMFEIYLILLTELNAIYFYKKGLGLKNILNLIFFLLVEDFNSCFFSNSENLIIFKLNLNLFQIIFLIKKVYLELKFSIPETLFKEEFLEKVILSLLVIFSFQKNLVKVKSIFSHFLSINYFHPNFEPILTQPNIFLFIFLFLQKNSNFYLYLPISVQKKISMFN